MSILLPLFVLPLLGLLSGVKPHLQLLALVIPYSETLGYDMTGLISLFVMFSPSPRIVICRVLLEAMVE